MTAKAGKNFEKVFRQLEEIGMLLVSGNEWPDVRSLITGKVSKGSWWSDSAAQEIFAVSELLDDHPDVTPAKLISKKVTFVHRKLWRELLAIGTARDDWQSKGLSAAGLSLLKQLDKEGTIMTNKLPRSPGANPGNATLELERRLLIHAEQIHTESGAHAKLIETWKTWAKRVGFEKRPLDSLRARQSLENRIEKVNKEYSGKGQLPWQLKVL
jgi:hypothetical protein